MSEEILSSLRALNNVENVSVVMNSDDETHKIHMQGKWSLYPGDKHGFLLTGAIMQSIAIKRVSFVNVSARVISIF